jgi:hypothetical protein
MATINAINNKAYVFNSDTTITAGTGITVTSGNISCINGITNVGFNIGNTFTKGIRFGASNYIMIRGGSTENDDNDIYIGRSSNIGKFNNFCIIIGNGIANTGSTINRTIAIGRHALHTPTGTVSESVCIGNYSGYEASEEFKVAIGTDSCRSNKGSGVVGVGAYSLRGGGTGDDNTAVGLYTMINGSGDGIANTAIGRSAGRNFIVNNGGNYNIGIGYYAGASYVGPSVNNIFIGKESGYNSSVSTLTGSYNVLIGSLAGSVYTSTESSNIIIGNEVVGVVGESNKIRIGTYGTGNGQQDTAYIAGVVHLSNGLVVDAGDATVTTGGVMYSDTFDTNVTAAGVTLSGTTLAADGTDSNITINITPKGTGTVNAPIGINAQTDDYQLVIGDAGKLITMNKATAVTLTVPKSATVAFNIGTRILVSQTNTGVVTIAPEDGAITIVSLNSNTDIAGQYGTAELIKIDTDVWLLFGDLA